MYNTDLGQSLQDQSSFSSISILQISLSFQPHLLSLCFSNRFNGGGLGLTDAADLLSLSLRSEHLLLPGGGLEKHHKELLFFTYVSRHISFERCVFCYRGRSSLLDNLDNLAKKQRIG